MDCHHPNSRIFIEQVAVHFIARLRDIAAYFDSQEEHRFFSSSLLFVYDAHAGEADASDMESQSQAIRSENTGIYMIDFGHVFPIDDEQRGNRDSSDAADVQTKDEGYLHGIKRLIHELELIVKTS